MEGARLLQGHPAARNATDEHRRSAGPCPLLALTQVLAGEGSELAIETWKLLAPADAEEGLRQFRLILAGETSRSMPKRLGSDSSRWCSKNSSDSTKRSRLTTSSAHSRPSWRHTDTHSTSATTASGYERYELACRRFLEQIRTDLDKRPHPLADPFSPAYNGYPNPQPNLLNLGRAEVASTGTTGASIGIDASDAVAEAKVGTSKLRMRSGRNEA